MSEDRTRTKPRGEGDPDLFSDAGFDAGSDLEAPAESVDRDATSGGIGSRIGDRARDVFSPRAFLLALVLSAVGLVAANAVVPIPFSGLLGVFAATFLLGLAVDRRRYAETAVAAGSVVGTSTLADFFVVSVLAGIGLPLVAIGAGAGAAVGVLGLYFGRDLRAGLTRDL